MNRRPFVAATLNDRNKALGDPGNDPAKLIASLQQMAAVTSDALARLRALPTPPGDGPALSAIFGKVDLLLTHVNGTVSALRAGDQKSAAALVEGLDADQNAANGASNAYGLTVCGS